MENIAKALIRAQSEMGNAIKGSTNPFFKSKYADLNSVREAVIPSLNNNGIAVLQPIIHIDGFDFVKTILIHESGETIESINRIVCAKPNDAQSYGSGLTYARRYGLQSLLNVGADDDDGNKAQPTKQKKNVLPIAQKENIEKAIELKVSLEQIKERYEVSKEMEDYFNELTKK